MTDLSLLQLEALSEGPGKDARLPFFGWLRRIPIGAYSTLVLLLAWQVAAAARLVPPLFLPAPLDVLRQFIAVAETGFSNATLWQHAAASLQRVGLAFALAAGIGIPLGLAMGVNRWARGLFAPPIAFYWPIPPLAYLPLIIIWLGIGEAAKVALIALAMFAPIVIAAQAGVRSVSPGRVQAALSLGASRAQVFFHVIARGALPEILTGLRIGIGAGWGTLVAAELVAATKGLGFMTLSAAQFLVTDVVFVGIFAIAALAILCLAALRLAERLLTPWKGQE
ncbi:MAG TPA: ABC transporter permease subunit [Alphaproteobacteria bacterium]|nr:ABC transporter permease subunit [Alphaproteobacteria bacterium]